MATKIFVNLPVKNLDRTMDFFKKLGFAFNAKFTNADAGCMILGENIFVMLVVEKYFKTFIEKEIVDASKYAEAILAIDTDSRSAVDEMIKNVIESGGKEPKPVQDHGWMYSRSFEDPDGHLWEVMYLDEKALPAEIH